MLKQEIVKQNTSTLQATSSNLISKPGMKMVVNMVPCKSVKLPRPIYTIIPKRELIKSIKSQPRILPVPESPTSKYICSNKNLIKSHISKRHTRNNKSYECEICGCKYKKKAYLSRHLQMHRSERPFTCPICGLKFLYKGHILRHLKLHTDVTPFECNICDMKFSRKNQLICHLKVHEDEMSTQFSNDNEDEDSPSMIKEETLVEEFQDEKAVLSPREDFHQIVCNIKKEPESEIFEEEKFEHETCRRSVYIKETPELEDKIAPVSANGKSLSCDICTYITSDDLTLARHLRKHTGQKPFSCDFCNFKCAMERNLTKHFKSHSIDERTRVCEICDAKFLFKRSFEKHMAHHTNKRLYPCKICGLKFSQYAEKVRHLTTHTSEELLTCDICGLKVLSKLELNTHLEKHRNEKYTCDVCGLKFGREYQLRCHSRIHSAIIPFECEICHLKFAEETYLQVHMRNHTGEKPFQCPSCPMNFNREIQLRLHSVVHMGFWNFGYGKQLLCQWCNYKCTLKRELRKHIQTHPCD